MATKHDPFEDRAERELAITRIFDAPRSLVFKVWTDPKHLVRWWGPRDFTTPSCKMDVRQGGIYRICIRSAEGKDYWMQGVYREVVEPDRLVFTFAEQDGKTKLTFHQALFESTDERDSHREGWSECFDRLETYLAKL